MSQQRQFQMVVGNNPGGHYNDTTFTKIFVGGLAWETQRDTMRRYFEQFGEILEAVVITDKNTGRSKGYGFVTFKDSESAMRACQNPSPVIDGRRANCNLASLGAQKTRSSTNPQHGPGRFRSAPAGLVAPPAFHGSSSTLVHHHQPSGQYTFPYSAYGYSGYTQDPLYPLNYYNVYGGQQFSPYNTAGTSGAAPGMFHNFYPIYAQYAQSSQAHGFGVQYPQMVQYPYLPQHYAGSSTGILSLPPSLAMTTTGTGLNITGATTTSTITGATTTSTTISTTSTPPTMTTTGVIGAGAATTSQQASSGTASEQNSSAK
ncbi:RNA-binding family protein isoform 1 [Tripterygium wilfordii]|uniref:RNA-binding family protein isoform 1 n=1 Tax=Tripterygium wilfordii TaxID=458696 RepID=A0A7J7CD32_TRIWF|nr:RNA-binding protein 38 [Tripterygium wilfordii]KAF5732000.1 RNA-binding family protein isoform 1 [Tripterygium wilfordii]